MISVKNLLRKLKVSGPGKEDEDVFEGGIPWDSGAHAYGPDPATRVTFCWHPPLYPVYKEKTVSGKQTLRSWFSKRGSRRKSA